MPDLLTSVPAQPGMLTRGAPILTTVTRDEWPAGVAAYPGVGLPGLVHAIGMTTGIPVCGVKLDDRPGGLLQMRQSWVSLDLTEPLGRAVGWAWLDRVEIPIRALGRPEGLSHDDVRDLLRRAGCWLDMTPEQVDRFARLILAVGREV